MLKDYPVTDLLALLARLERTRLAVQGLRAHMTNDRPWAAHWQGGDATETQPAEFQAACDDIARALAALDAADHKIAMMALGRHIADLAVEHRGLPVADPASFAAAAATLNACVSAGTLTRWTLTDDLIVTFPAPPDDCEDCGEESDHAVHAICAPLAAQMGFPHLRGGGYDEISRWIAYRR